MSVIVRPLVATDSVDAVHVFFDAIHHGTTDVYTKEQRLAWAGPTPNVEGWLERFEDVDGFVAHVNAELVGFVTIDKSGYIDLAFVKANQSGKGIGRLLYQSIELQAHKFGTEKLTTNASKEAMPFFEQMGWKIDQQQTVTTSGVELTNFRMSKSLA